MNRKNKKNIQIIRDILSTLNVEHVRRKVVVEAVIAKGLIVNDTWPVIKPCAKSVERGYYEVAKMIALADVILNKGKKVVEPVIEETPANSNVDQINAMFDRIMLEEAIMEEAVTQPNGKSYGFAPLAPNEDDIADELSLMGTQLA